MSSLKGIVEPLSGIFKHEERVIAWRLCLPSSIVFRMPFPGPGLSIRNVGEITEDSPQLTGTVNSIVEDRVREWMVKTYGTPMIIEPSGLHRPWQAFSFLIKNRIMECKYYRRIKDIVERNGARFMNAFLLELRMTGVKGDSRTYDRPLVIETCEKVLPYEAYEHIFLKITSIPMFKVSRVLFATDMRGSDGYVAGFRMVESVHAMTTRNMKISKELAEDISERLSLPNVNFACDISNKSSATIESE